MNCDFQKQMIKIHKPIKVVSEKCENEIAVPQNVKIYLNNKDDVSLTAVKDFIKYLKVAFKINAVLTDSKDAFFRFFIDESKLKDVKGYMGRRTIVKDDCVCIYSFDSRGLAQGIYSLEDKMNLRMAPYLEISDIENMAEFSPKMVHSGYGLDQYPDEYLSVCAHHGYDAILVFLKDETHSAHGECDFNDIISRAKKFGIDVYAYSYFMNFVHPEEENAKEIYKKVYGGIFEKLPELKGIVFVGESIEFPSRDPHVVPYHHRMKSPDGMPFDKPFPGWWPCTDYKEWLTLVRDSIHSVSPEADVVFWTYNFGPAPEEDRIKLIKSLPDDVSVLITFEMFDKIKHENSFGAVRDYTISHIGPSKVFLAEAAEVAKKKNVRLYSQANTAGRTWDYGTAPYEPFPYQWNERNEALKKAKKEFGLSGLMESHHYGFYPSFISLLAKDTFTKNSLPFEERLLKYANTLTDEGDKFMEAIKYIDEAVTHCTASKENQYGPMRIGPAFPLCVKNGYKKPSEAGTLFGNGIYTTLNLNDDWDFQGVYSLRINDEINEQKKAIELFRKGIGILKTIKNKRSELKQFINLCEYLMRCHITAKNSKEFELNRRKMFASTNKNDVNKFAKKMESIALKELENAKKTIPLLRKDSSLGYEASMGYAGGEEAILWKIKHTEFMLQVELHPYLT